VLPRINLTPLLLFVPTARAQLVADGATNTLSNVTTNITGDVTVGTNLSFTLLILSDNALLTNSVNGIIGRNDTARSNEVRLVSPSARWRMGNALFVGNSGSANRLVVSNGAVVADVDGFLGHDPGASNNVAVVTGVGSLWTNNSGLLVGYQGGGNQLVVGNGALVADDTGYLGYFASANNNVAVVTGAGSVWSNRLNLNVGFDGAGNQLVVSNGAFVRANIGQIGFNPSSSNNLALVTGAGSVWSNANELYVGFTGAGNRLVVSNGANVFNSTGTVGGDGAGNDLAVVTGAGSMWSNASILVGNFAASNRLVVSEGGLLRDNFGFVGVDATSSNNAALVTGLGSVWTNGLDLYIGWSSPGNQLVISNGAAVLTAGAGFVGLNANARLNSTTVTDPGTRWLLSSNLYVGNDGASSRFVVSNAALVANLNGFLGFGVSSSSNVALITGAGSVWSNRDEIFVGQGGNGNRLEVRDGARVESLFATLGRFESASNNVAVVTDPGSFWRTEEDLVVGLRSGGNRLVITNGGRVRGGGTIGSISSSTNNEVVVTGAGSSWTNLNGLLVGDDGSRNRLVITNGGEVFSEFGVFLGRSPGATNNRIVVDGGALRSLDPVEGILDVCRGTNVLNAGLIDVNRLLLTNAQGKFEFNGGTLITRGATISNGTPFVVGTSGTTPATWDVRAGASDHFVLETLLVGADSSFNQLILTNGALLTNYGYASLGSFSVARSNSVTLAGAGSRWGLGDGVFVGDSGSDNRLVVSNGASLVTASISYLGTEITSSNNEAVVTGPGSSWTSDPVYGLRVGYRGRNNLLRVNDGAQIASGPSVLGELPTGSNNLALVTDAGSRWNIQGELRVGESAAANHLVVSNGASVFATDAVYVGLDPTSTGNRLTVDGGTLRTTNASVTGVLDVRRGTNVLNAGLIDVDQLVLTNTLGLFEFNGGTLHTGGTTNSNGHAFIVGSGTSAATLQMQGGTHVFANQLFIANNASLVGNGTVIGTLIVAGGGNLIPGASVGKIVLSNSPMLSGAVIMEISKSGSVLTNDEIQVTGTFTYGGALTVTNIGPTALTTSNRFKLFSAGVFAGSFAPISLPPLNAGLDWTNKLLVDGSIEVVGVSLPKFSSIKLSGTNVILSGTGGTPNAPYAVLTATNVTTPLSNWLSILTNQFDSGGGFSFTNGIAPGEPQRYFRIRTP